jgi:hypothetical protein
VVSDDNVLLACWYQLMSEGSFAATFYAFQVVCQSRETGQVVQVRWFPKDHQ